MFLRTLILTAVCCELGACASDGASPKGSVGVEGSTPISAPGGSVLNAAPEPLIIGDTFTIESLIMGEARRVTIFEPTVYGEKPDAPLPVLYMLDGGLNEDFLHIAGLVQVLVSNGGMRPFILVGIPNTNRRRDMTGPTLSPEDRKIAPVVGGSAVFRSFIREELMPAVRARYRTTDEAAIIGESLAGLFVVETCLLEPDLFSCYIAIDPSIWWNNQELLKTADKHLTASSPGRKQVFLASSDEPGLAKLAGELAAKFSSAGDVTFRYAPLPSETHATIYHPAALLAFRAMLAPPGPVEK